MFQHHEPTKTIEDIKVMAEEFCWRQVEGLAEFHRIVNISIAVPYFLIGLLLVLIALVLAHQNQREIELIWQNRRFDAKTFTLTFIILLIFVFGIFIFDCGLGHYGDYYVIDNATFLGWNSFWVLGYQKATTAVVSIFSAILFTGFVVVLLASKTKYKAFRLMVKIFLIPEAEVRTNLSASINHLEEKLEKKLDEMLQ